jgi:hypothetical protein
MKLVGKRKRESDERQQRGEYGESETVVFLLSRSPGGSTSCSLCKVKLQLKESKALRTENRWSVRKCNVLWARGKKSIQSVRSEL